MYFCRDSGVDRYEAFRCRYDSFSHDCFPRVLNGDYHQFLVLSDNKTYYYVLSIPEVHTGKRIVHTIDKIW